MPYETLYRLLLLTYILLIQFITFQLPTPSSTISSTETTATSPGPLSVLEVADPKLCVLAHLMSPLEPIDPLLESPLAHPLFKQRTAASELLTEVQQTNTALSGMLLANMERNGI